MTIDEYRRGIPNYKGENGQTVGMLCETKEQCITDDDGVSLPDKLEGLKKYTDDAYANSNLYTDKKIGELINGAPTTLDTLKEIADAMEDNADVVEALDKAVGSKVDQAEYDGHADNGTIHITAEERAKWNSNSGGSADLSDYLPLDGSKAMTNYLDIGNTSTSNSKTLTIKNALRHIQHQVRSNGAYYVDDVTNGVNIITSLADGTTTANLTATGNLPLSGGIVESSSTSPIEIKGPSSNCQIAYWNNGVLSGGLGFSGKDKPTYTNSAWNRTYPLLHTGNIDTAPWTELTSGFDLNNALGRYRTQSGAIVNSLLNLPSSSLNLAGCEIIVEFFLATTNSPYGIQTAVLSNSGKFEKWTRHKSGATTWGKWKQTLDTGNSAKCVVVDTDPGVGASVSYADGTLIFVKE